MAETLDNKQYVRDSLLSTKRAGMEDLKQDTFNREEMPVIIK